MALMRILPPDRALRRTGVALATMASASVVAVSPVAGDKIPALWPFLLGGLVLMKLALAADGWREARVGASRATHR